MPTPLFDPDPRLLDKARAQLSAAPLYWLIGSSCSGKSTLARALAEQTGLAVYDMDEAVFGRFRFQARRHPATTAWFGAADPLAFMLSLPWVEFDALYRASNAEYLDLLGDDLAGAAAPRPYLVDGGITHPGLLAQVVPAARIACLTAPAAERARLWATAPERAGMRDAIQALPDGAEKWRTFLQFDERMDHTLVEESRASGIRVFDRSGVAVQELAAVVAAHFGL